MGHIAGSLPCAPRTRGAVLGAGATDSPHGPIHFGHDLPVDHPMHSAGRMQGFVVGTPRGCGVRRRACQRHRRGSVERFRGIAVLPKSRASVREALLPGTGWRQAASSSEPPTSVGLACRPVGACRRHLVKHLDSTGAPVGAAQHDGESHPFGGESGHPVGMAGAFARSRPGMLRASGVDVGDALTHQDTRVLVSFTGVDVP